MKAIILIGALAIAGAPAVYGQAAASLSPAPRLQFFDNAGKPLAGGCIQSYQAGSTTPLATYSNAAGAANPNPVILDAYGRADIWLGGGIAYKLVIRAKTTGCAGGGGAILYTTDGIIDQGFSLAHSLQAGTLAIGLRSSPATGAGGGVGVGNALLSATTTGLYVSVNGGAPVLLNGGGGGGSGSPGGPINSVQYNSGAALGGSLNMVWDNPDAIMTICGPPATGCTPNSGFQAPTFSSSATGINNAFETAGGTFTIKGNGDGLFQDLSVTATFNSLATGSTSAIQQASGTFRITGAGAGLFQSVAMGLQAAPVTGIGGGTGVGSAQLSATTAGLYLSLNGGAPALITGGGGAGSPGAPINSIQYNNAGTFAGTANLLWNNSANQMTITGAATAGFQAPAFSSSNSGTAVAYTNSGGTFQVFGNGDGLFQDLSVTATFNSLATGATSAIQQGSGTFRITGAGDGLFQTTALGLKNAAVTGLGGGTGVGNALLSATTAGLYLSLNGAPPVALTGGGGGSGTPGGPATSIQYNNAGAFAGSANLVFNSTANIMTITGGVNAGFQAPVFSSSATGTNAAFVANNGAAQILGNGDATFQNVVVNATFNSVATGATKVIQQSSGTFSITGAGDAGFQSTALGLKAAATTGLGGGTGVGNAMLSATTAGLWLSVNGGAPALLAAGGAPGGPSGAVQFNSGGVFTGNSNFVVTGGGVVTVCAPPAVNCTVNSGYQGPSFSSSATGANPAFVAGNGAGQINGNGAAAFQSLALTGGITVGNGFYGLTGGGALTVSSCSGCSAGVTSWNARTGAVALTKADVTTVEGQGLGTADSVSFNAVTANQHNGGTYAGTLYNCSSAGSSSCFQQSSGRFQINGDGNAYFQSLCVINGFPGSDTCNGVTPAAGSVVGSGISALTLGATIRNTAANYGIAETDTGGNCNIGTAYAGGIGCASDARLKTKIADLPAALAGVLKLRPVTFTWTKNSAPGIGFIAQDVEKVFPGVVRKETDGYLSVAYMGLIPELVKAIQELTARVAVLEGHK
ncbi:MAG TPA: tail fiber domain-containing protein [Casimicrobiaceae bacterium]|jgi:hypothetical protein|nr:tail fiber domain-containing protein [Casimicrobiaceae bacterium]